MKWRKKEKKVIEGSVLTGYFSYKWDSKERSRSMIYVHDSITLKF